MSDDPLAGCDAALVMRPSVSRRMLFVLRVPAINFLHGRLQAVEEGTFRGPPHSALRLLVGGDGGAPASTSASLIALGAEPKVESKRILETAPLVGPSARRALALASCQVGIDLLVVQALPRIDPSTLSPDRFQLWHTLAVVHDPQGPFESDLRELEAKHWADARRHHLPEGHRPGAGGGS